MASEKSRQASGGKPKRRPFASGGTREMAPEEAELKGYCKECGKAYPDEQLKTEVNLSSDGWFEDYALKCPKGHVIYFKD